MNEFREAFRSAALSAVEGIRTPAIMEFGTEKDTVVIPEQRKGGFSTRLDCFDYGVYPSVRGWHGGCWDITAVSPEELASEISGFVDSILNDAILEIRYSNMKAYKWLLNYQIKGSRAREETGLLLFNWFGSRSVQRFSNGDAA